MEKEICHVLKRDLSWINKKNVMAEVGHCRIFSIHGKDFSKVRLIRTRIFVTDL